MPAWLGGMFIKAVLDWLFGVISKLIASWQKDKAAHTSAVNQADQDMKKTEKLKPDSTEAEIDEAIKDSLKHF
jgi:hypothetical protein